MNTVTHARKVFDDLMLLLTLPQLFCIPTLASMHYYRDNIMACDPDVLTLSQRERAGLGVQKMLWHAQQGSSRAQLNKLENG
uniref:Uncharacterized protein n=1 Tax=Oryza sativa subsp. japonica TaxID=39947 RepID=Q69T14_ORYSJ|nr:hypothetical protein [Oryza sativa Japonica Group]BAD35918.1 hypothetical protein [Oryza sativa Japonica Group]